MKNQDLLSFTAKRIKELRIKNNISQSDFLVDTGIHIGRIESGKRDISISTLYAVIDYFEMSVGEFFRGYKK